MTGDIRQKCDDEIVRSEAIRRSEQRCRLLWEMSGLVLTSVNRCSVAQIQVGNCWGVQSSVAIAAKKASRPAGTLTCAELS